MTDLSRVLRARSRSVASRALSSPSLRFPQANAGLDAGAYSTLAASGITAMDPLFGSPGALVIQLEIPWREIAGTRDRLVHILSNHPGIDAEAPGEFSITATNPNTEMAAPSVTVSAHNGKTAVAATCVLPDRWTERMLLVVQVDFLARMTLACYADGVAVGTVGYFAGERTLAGLTLRHHGFLLGAPSEGGSLTPTTLGGRTGFPGSIGFVGYHDGPVSTAAAETLSAGAGFDTALLPGAWRFARVLAARTGPVAAADWAVGDTLPAWTRRTRSTWRRGSDLAPARDGSGNWLALDTIRDGTVWGVPVGSSEVAVPLSGASSGLAGGLEARALHASGAVHTDWTPVPGVDLTGGGAWSGACVLSLFTDGWGVIEIRSAENPDLVFRSRAFCGVGYVASLIAQSTGNYPLSPDLAQAGEPITVSAYGNLSYAIMYHPAGGTGFAVGRVTAENPIGGGFFLGAAAELRRYAATPVMLFDMTVSGTGIQEYLQDGTGREWANEVTPMIAMTSPLVSIHTLLWATAAGYSWYSIGQAKGDERLDALIFGTAAGSTAGWTIDHYLLDGELADTAVVMHAPRFNSANDLSVSDDHSLWTTRAYADLPNGAKSYSKYEELYAAARAAPGWWAQAPDSYDNYSTGTHVEDREYNSRFGRRWVQALMRATGHDTTTDPEIVGVAINPAGDVITVTVSLPNGGDLHTRWSFEGTPVPAGENPVQGFEVANLADANATRSGFTTAITDTGSGTGADRTGTVAITLDTPLDPGAILYYLVGREMAYGETANARELIDGLLYESGPAEGGLGLMVRARVIRQARPVMPATDIPHTACALDLNTAVMFQERDTVSGGTPVGLGDPIGTIVPVGSKGGYFTAQSDAIRPLLKQDPSGARHAECLGGKGLVYKSGAGTEAPLLPANNTFHFGAAVQQLQDTTEGMVFSQHLSGEAGRMVFRHNLGANAGWWTFNWNGVTNAFRTGGTVPRELVFRTDDPPLAMQVNVADGSEATTLHAPVFVNDTFTVSAAGVGQSRPFRIGVNDDLTSSPDGAFKLYALIVNDATLTDDELALARTWLMTAAGRDYPHR